MLFKPVVILCLVINQQCFVVEPKEPTIKTFKDEAQCEVVAEKFADEVLAMSEGKIMQPHFVRYGCEKIDMI